MKKQKKIGVVGGSFNPIHNAHLVIAEQFREQLQLDLVLFIPSNISPNKIDTQHEYIDAMHRLNMLNLACRNNKQFIVDEVEILRSGISFTIDTLRYLRDKYINADLFLLIGEDQAKVFNHWNKWQDIIKLSQLCIAGRELNENTNTRMQIERMFNNTQYNPIWIHSPLLEISSSSIRKSINEGKSIRYQIPTSVFNYIKKNELYKEK